MADMEAMEAMADMADMADMATFVVPPGMVLRRLSRPGSGLVVWSAEDGERATFASCWEALDAAIPSFEEEHVVCEFGPAAGVEDDEAFRRCLLRDALLPSGRSGSYQSHLSGAETSATSPNKYYKLNIGRIALPAKRATLEFRQFAGKDLQQTLVIWGWVRFVGAFVVAAAKRGVVSNDDAVKEATERDLFDLLEIQNDTMLLCWWRDVANSVMEPRTEVAAVKRHFAGLFDDWLRKSRVADALRDDDDDDDDRRRRRRYGGGGAKRVSEEEGGDDAGEDLLAADDEDDLLLTGPGWSSSSSSRAWLVEANEGGSFGACSVRDDDDDDEDSSSSSSSDHRELEAIIEACDAWRAVFHAASALKAVVPPEDASVWGRFASSASVASAFVGGVAEALEGCLVAYCRKLRAAEEVSRTAGLVATAELCCGSELRNLRRSLHAVQAAVVETRGDAALPLGLRLRVANLNDKARDISVKHAANLLRLCEAAAGDLLALPRQRRRRQTDAAWALRRAFKYLCGVLLAPRVNEAPALWEGLAAEGWTDDRVLGLNDAVHRAVFSFFFARREEKTAEDTGGRRRRHFGREPPFRHRLPEDPRFDDDDDDVTMARAPQAAPQKVRRPDFQTLFARHDHENDDEAGPSYAGGESAGGATDDDDATTTGAAVIDMTDVLPN